MGLGAQKLEAWGTKDKLTCHSVLTRVDCSLGVLTKDPQYKIYQESL